jgi:TRAP-type C4-dicarboxylate transport system permease small subunit
VHADICTSPLQIASFLVRRLQAENKFFGADMTRILDYFYRGLLSGAALCMVATLIIVLLSIAGRQLGFNIPGLDAYAGYAIAGALFLALPCTLRNGDHIRVTLALNKLPEKARVVAEYWCLLAASAVSLYVAYYAVDLVWISHQMHDVSQSNDMTPLWIPQLAMALGCVGLAVAFIETLVLNITGREAVINSAAELARTE